MAVLQAAVVAPLLVLLLVALLPPPPPPLLLLPLRLLMQAAHPQRPTRRCRAPTLNPTGAGGRAQEHA